MHRIAMFLCWAAGCALVVTPVAMPHAHIHDGHGDVFVHSGHGHAFGGVEVEYHGDPHHVGHGEPHSDAFEQEHSSERHESVLADGTVQPVGQAILALISSGSHLAHAHVVQLGTDSIASPSKPLPKCIPSKILVGPSAAPDTRCSRLILAFDIGFRSQHTLPPPSRGPPALILQAV